MADNLPPNQRSFTCPHCSGLITIPIDLPPTTGPCPHCGQSITSPAPEVASEPVSMRPPERHVPKRESESAPLRATATPSARRAIPEPIDAAARRSLEKKRASRKNFDSRILISILLGLVILMGGMWLFLSQNSKKAAQSQSPELAAEIEAENRKKYLAYGWQEDVRKTLKEFIAADTPEKVAALSLGGAGLLPKIKKFYEAGMLHNSDISVDLFAPVRLLDQDRERGIFMMNYWLPASYKMSDFFAPIVPQRVQYGIEEQDTLLRTTSNITNFLDEPTSILAIFKETPDGLKIDWETFMQTKYRLLRDFIDLPERNKAKIFRVLINETVPDNRAIPAGDRMYLVASPINPREDNIRLNIPVDSSLGNILSVLNWRDTISGSPTPKTATVELKWTDEENPKLEISRFLCWEFLGVGGELGDVKTTEKLDDGK